MEKMPPQSIEMNFDGLVGPTHNYSGLSYGNIASMTTYGKQTVSNPKEAALQGLEKMKTLTSLGIAQGIIPPQERPFIPVLHSLGFSGNEAQILEKAWNINPSILMACSSAACMWTANAATVSPSSDSIDQRVHFTPANLISKFHRSFEAHTTALILHAIFNHPAYFAHHHPLPYHTDFSDEGAANHTRFCKSYDTPGVQLFVYGRAIAQNNLPKLYPARQTDEASKAIIRLHRLHPDKIILAQQNPDAIDAGVFHNDVISVGNQNVFFYHEKAFVNTTQVIEQLRTLLETQCNVELFPIEVKESQVSLKEAVRTYLFNSQIVTLPDQTMALIAPQECQNSEVVNSLLHSVTTNPSCPIKHVIFQDIRESMQNGGGPACLRLRVVLNNIELKNVLPTVIFNESLYFKLKEWVEKHYRDKLSPDDLADPLLLEENKRALDELTDLLDLGPIYSFQRMAKPNPGWLEKFQ